MALLISPDRHILEAQAIDAGAWVEREEWTGQDVLVWREKRRDGSPGATRRRLLTPVRANGKKQAKVRWQYAGQKTDEPFHYIGTLDMTLNKRNRCTPAGISIS